MLSVFRYEILFINTNSDCNTNYICFISHSLNNFITFKWRRAIQNVAQSNAYILHDNDNKFGFGINGLFKRLTTSKKFCIF